VFFAKEKSEVEVINDTNTEVINFYKQVQHNFVALDKEITITLHSREAHLKASVIYKYARWFTELQRAWAFWTLASQSFASKIDGSWGYDKKRNTTSKKVSNKRIRFSEEYAIRLQDIQIECTDALRIIASRDWEEAFFYIDPPYFNSDCGHYKGYTKADFEELLQLLTELKGKFLLSSYPSELLSEYSKKNDWHTIKVPKVVSVAKGKRKPKTEVLTANYPISLQAA
jgi:DNA adenine methylase